MTLFAKLITSKTIAEIKELNGGAALPKWTQDKNTFFVYGEHHADFIPKILKRPDFEKLYRWQDVNTTDNVVVPR